MRLCNGSKHKEIVMSQFSVVLVCPHCGQQMTQELHTSSTQPVTCKSSNGGCGKSYRVSTGPKPGEVKRIYK